MRALIVDDSHFIREYTRQHLERLGLLCVDAANGMEALRVLREEVGFDVMLLDLFMPVMDGLDCVRHLRADARWEQMNVMIVTAEADHSVIGEALECGADEFLMKPFTSQSLSEKLLLMGLPACA